MKQKASSKHPIEENTFRNSIRIQYIILAISSIVIVIKIYAYYLTKSTAILTDALEYIINIMAGAIGLYSLIIASKPRDENHPYGHGKIEYVTSGIEGGMIFIAGGYIIGKAVYGFFYPHEITILDVGLLLTSFTGVINYVLGVTVERKAKANHSMVLLACGKHLKSDAYASFTLIAGLIILWITKLNWLDNVIALVFGGFIFYMGFKIIRKSVGGIMDEADMILISELIEVIKANRKDSIIDIHNLRVITYGQTLHIDCYFTMPWYKTLKEIHKETEKFESIINERFGRKMEFFIHPEHCIPESCHICMIKNCEFRQYPFERKLEWDAAQLFPNEQHNLNT